MKLTQSVVGLLAYYSGRAAADAIQRYGLYAAAGLAVVLVGGWLLVRRARRRAQAHLGA